MTDNPLYLRHPRDICPVCGTNLRTGTGDSSLRACPLGPHQETDYPDNAA